MDALRRAYPNARIVAAATAGTVELLTSYQLIDDAINLGAGASGQSIGKTILEELKLAKRTQHMRFDLLLAFSGLSLVQFLFRLRMRSRIISPLIKPADLIDPLFGGDARRRGRGPAAYHSILRQLGLKPADSDWKIRSSENEDARFERLLERGEANPGGRPVAVLYSGGPVTFGWPFDRFADLANRLSSGYEARIVICDSPYGSGFTSSMSPLLPKSAIALRAPRAIEVVAALARATIVITDDPGIARFAAQLGAPAIDLSGPVQKGPECLVYGVSGDKPQATDAVFDVACEIMQKSRMASLFRR